MKAEISETSENFFLELEPENIKEVNQLFRFTNGTIKGSVKIEFFYKDEKASCWVKSSVNKKKDIGDLLSSRW